MVMGELVDPGRKQPNGSKIVELRKRNGMKQEVLAGGADISVRLLRDIEKKDYPVPSTTITALATALKVQPDEITVATSDVSPAPNLLKLQAVRSAIDLSNLASRAMDYKWRLKVDPSAVTALEMQGVMMIVRRLVNGPGMDGGAYLDEFDEQYFGEIPRLARLNELLTNLRAHGVGVVAAEFVYRHANNERTFVLCMHFVPHEVEEEVVSPDDYTPPDPPDEIPF
jgi:transcriptional regulator with XRE-family HTH domain